VALDLSEFIPALKREVSVPGTTGILDAASFDDLVGILVDAFWLARLDGFFAAYTCSEDGVVEHLDGGLDLPREHVSVILLYAGIKVVRNKILGTSSGLRAKAGPVEYETSIPATVMTALLTGLRETQRHLLDEVREEGGYEATTVDTFDWLSRYIPVDA
jgi:hypothetical protein